MQVKDCVNWYRHDMDVTDHINETVGPNDELTFLGICAVAVLGVFIMRLCISRVCVAPQ